MKPVFNVLLATLLVSGLYPAVAQSASLKGMEGAWTLNGVDCADNFKKEGNRTVFKDRTASTTLGIIVHGDRVEGPNSICRAGNLHESNGHLSVQLSCDGLSYGSYTAIFKVVDENTFQRLDPLGTDLYMTYRKCSM